MVQITHEAPALHPRICSPVECSTERIEAVHTEDQEQRNVPSHCQPDLRPFSAINPGIYRTTIIFV